MHVAYRSIQVTTYVYMFVYKQNGTVPEGIGVWTVQPLYVISPLLASGYHDSDTRLSLMSSHRGSQYIS